MITDFIGAKLLSINDTFRPHLFLNFSDPDGTIGFNSATYSLEGEVLGKKLLAIKKRTREFEFDGGKITVTRNA